MVLNARRRPLVMDGASGIDLLHYEISPTNNRNPGDLQVAVHAELVGSNRCHAEGFTARGSSPVPVLAPWKAFSRSAVSPPMRLNELPATLHHVVAT